MLSKTLRHPAVPLVTIDPHTNVWSMADRLHDDWPRHWTGSKMALFGVIRVDYDTLARTWKDSAHWYRRVAAANSLP